MKIHIASSRPIGKKCLDWLRLSINAAPTDCEITENPEESDIFISVMYAHLVSEEFIAARRCYNFHPGVLPQYRGSGAFSWAIINKEKHSGITLHELDVNIDSGPVIAIDRFAIEAWDTAETLFEKGMTTIEEMFQRWLPRIIEKQYTAVPQDESLAHTYYRKDLQAEADLSRYVRAFTFQGKAPAFYTTSAGAKVDLQW